jgi:hypothetical protein
LFRGCLSGFSPATVAFGLVSPPSGRRGGISSLTVLVNEAQTWTSPSTKGVCREGVVVGSFGYGLYFLGREVGECQVLAKVANQSTGHSHPQIYGSMWRKSLKPHTSYFKLTSYTLKQHPWCKSSLILLYLFFLYTYKHNRQ